MGISHWLTGSPGQLMKSASISVSRHAPECLSISGWRALVIQRWLLWLLPYLKVFQLWRCEVTYCMRHVLREKESTCFEWVKKCVCCRSIAWNLDKQPIVDPKEDRLYFCSALGGNHSLESCMTSNSWRSFLPQPPEWVLESQAWASIPGS